MASLAVALALFTAPPPPVPPGTPSINQYVETIPTSAGATVAGTGAGKVVPLRPGVAVLLRSSHDAVSQTLRAAATSSAYGAPQSKLPVTGAAHGSPPIGSLKAVTQTLSDPGGGHDALWLAALIAATTASVLLAARAQRARRRAH
jgi:hypothetical protein